MSRIYRALAWLRWRTLINTLRGGRRRAGGERLSRVLHVLVPILLTLLMVPSALALGLLGLAAGWLLATDQVDPAHVIPAARILLGVVAVTVVAWPLIRSSRGATDDLSRLMLLPIPRRALHLGELVSGLADPWILAFLPALLLLPAGILWNGEVVAGALVLAAGLSFLALLLVLGACSSFLLQLLLRDRRRAEMIALIVLVVLSIGGFLPALLVSDETLDERRRAGAERRVAADAEATPGEEDPTLPPAGAGGDRPAAPAAEPAAAGWHLRFPAWAHPLPSELYSRTLHLATAPGGRAAAAIPLSFLLLEAIALYSLSRWIHSRLLETPENSGRRRGGPRRVVAIRRLPGLGAAASAVAMAQFRTFLRTVKGKLSIFLAPVNVALLGLVLFRFIDEEDFAGLPVDKAALLAYIAVAFSQLGVHPVLLNMFATDRAGLSLQFLAPVSDRELVRGKLAGAAMLAALPAAGGALAALLIVRGGSPLLWITALLGGVSAYLLFAPLGALLSALLPKDADLSSLGNAGNPHSAAALLGVFLTVASLAPPAGLTLVAILLLDSAPLALGLVAGWTVLSAAIAWVVVRLAAGVLEERRESLALVAQGR